MRRYSLLTTLIFVALCALLTACGGKTSRVAADDFTEKVYEPTYAEHFAILGAEGKQSVIVEIRNPWQGAKDEVRRVLLRRGDEPVPEGFEGTVIDGDVERMICMSTSYIGMLAALGESERIVGVSGLDYVSDSTVNARRDKVYDVGYETNIDYERVVAAEPDLVILYGVECANPMETKLQSLNIPYIYIGDYLEESPLGKAEWMVVMAELLGRRDEGIRIFSAIPERYNVLKAMADSLENRPVVMLNTPYADTWVMPPATSYACRLIKDAGGKYVLEDQPSESLRTVGIEEAWKLARTADVWMQTGAISSLDELRRACPRFADTPPMVNGNVWNCDLRNTGHGGNDYWESGIVHPDLILRDMIKILHPEVLKDQPFVYYRRI